MRFVNAVLLDVNAGFGVNADFGERVIVRVDVRRLNMVATPLYYVLLRLRAIEGNYCYFFVLLLIKRPTQQLII